jgi:hypothetical protein
VEGGGSAAGVRRCTGAGYAGRRRFLAGTTVTLEYPPDCETVRRLEATRGMKRPLTTVIPALSFFGLSAMVSLLSGGHTSV